MPEGPEIVDPVAMLQERLGVDEDQARDLANIKVVCLGKGDHEASLGEFMISEHGADQAPVIVDIAAQAQEKGAAPEEAVAQALGIAAVRDKDTGALARVSPAESKKK